MFTGVSLNQALRYWENGKEVIVLDRTVKSPSGGYETYSLDELFKDLELLADVPADDGDQPVLVFKTPDRCKKEDGGSIDQNKRRESGDGEINNT